MLTRSQIQRLAQRNGIGLQVQERDYIQHALLFALYQRSQDLIFKGGTCIRIVHRGNRYSEDLDFNGQDDAAKMDLLWATVIGYLEAFGILAEIRNSWLSVAGFSFDVGYQGPLFDGRDRTKGKVRVDISLRAEMVETRRVLITPEYADLRSFVGTILTPEHLLAEKMRALVVRGKPRDVYDIWLLTQQGVRLDRELVNKKLALYQLVMDKSLLSRSLFATQSGWERDLKPLLPQFVPWEVIEASVLRLWQDDQADKV